MSHTEQESQSQALIRHFSSRVANQVRLLLDYWRVLSTSQWNEESLSTLEETTERLIRHSLRFDAKNHLEKADKIKHLLGEIRQAATQPNSAQLSALNDLIYALSESARRKNDTGSNIDLQIPTIRPVFIATAPELAKKIADQMQLFGITNDIIENKETFNQAVKSRLPCAVIMDIHFFGPNQGIEIINEWQKDSQRTVPTLFITAAPQATLEERLAATRANGLQFFVQPTPAQLISSVEQLRNELPLEPYRILIVDDSKSQAVYTEKALNIVGMVTRVETNPMQVLTAIDEFDPELIVMDMYMPGCEGTELASVIRQQTEYIRIPIVYLSGEEDKEKQLMAMSHGGDDFITKPADPTHLAATVQNRGQRARDLNNLIVRDSLTGLFNHTHILERLYQAQRKATDNNQPLSFAMVDIDFFKKINDNYGHPVGDKVISSLSLFLKQRLRKTDAIGRYGGEEFAVVLSDTKAEDALHVMNDIRQAFSQLAHSPGDTEFKVTFSCGICSYTDSNAEFMIEQADQALYVAKKAGRNNVQLFVEADEE